MVQKIYISCTTMCGSASFRSTPTRSPIHPIRVSVIAPPHRRFVRVFLGLALLASLTSVGFSSSQAHAQAMSADHDIVDTAAGAGQFNTLATALQAAGLVDTLKGPGPFTVFAPTDAAFAKLPPGTLESLLEPENKEQLRKILTYHVVAGEGM